ncbi:flagellar export protein FliJ [Thermosulfuriphilus ammonigenes]|uniref:Flagellar FliJ protein n=1 Tax=Thermosulfuriphilus ammonigenes TaxID=1936021 RepID=A0A6G7PYE6_9BACT|nr:flagellar export protein FliJ [Thermosulfuriphilus ammonigenes]MBA2849812.1 flagellar FliJ protein [Thermosulfuriphilus ammonigenes]QIJ72640.1 flagellar export protein FliJ [Thermosulfuriphilus ammonigenes]
MRFRFRFETLLRLRRQEEEMIRHELAQAMAEWEQLTEKITRARLELKEEMERLKGNLLWAQEVQDLGLGLDSRLANIENLEETRRQLVRKIEETRERLIEASKRRKILERLRERDLLAFRKEQEALWQKEIDELVVLRHGREEGHERV